MHDKLHNAGLMASKVEAEFEVKTEAQKLWNAVKDSVTLFPKALPQYYQSIQVLEGDGSSVGSVRLINYPPGLSEVASIKEKVEVVDEESKTYVYSVIEGDLLKFYNNFKGKLSVISRGENGSSVKWSCEFDKAAAEVPEPDFIKDFAAKTIHDLDAFLLAY